MTDYEYPDWMDYSEQADEETRPYWTVSRAIYVLILLITLIAFVLYVIYPALVPPQPYTPPILLPRQQV